MFHPHVFVPTLVADVELADGREVITHVPYSAFLLKPGVDMLIRPARDKKGILVGSTAVGKHGTPKCEFITQLVRVSEPENKHIDMLGVWVGAGPSLAEKLTHEMLKQGLLKELSPSILMVERNKSMPHQTKLLPIPCVIALV